ncbi:hypothetical protein YC2023_090365 [Brassica napus]
MRKMIGVSVAFMRNYTPESLIQTSFNSCTLKLDYTLINVSSLLITKDLKGSQEELSMEEYKEVAEDFKCKHVIGSAEEKDRIVAIWLNEKNYPDLCVA